MELIQRKYTTCMPEKRTERHNAAFTGSTMRKCTSLLAITLSADKACPKLITELLHDNRTITNSFSSLFTVLLIKTCGQIAFVCLFYNIKPSKLSVLFLRDIHSLADPLSRPFRRLFLLKHLKRTWSETMVHHKWCTRKDAVFGSGSTSMEHMYKKYYSLINASMKIIH